MSQTTMGGDFHQRTTKGYDLSPFYQFDIFQRYTVRCFFGQCICMLSVTFEIVTFTNRLNWFSFNKNSIEAQRVEWQQHDQAVRT